MYFKWSSCELHMKFICNYVWNIEVAMIFICISFEVNRTHRPELSNEISYEWYEPSVVPTPPPRLHRPCHRCRHSPSPPCLLFISSYAPWSIAIAIIIVMDFLPDMSNFGMRIRRECRERFLHHRRQRKPLVNDPDMHHTRAVMHGGIANSRWRGKRSRHSRRMRNSQFYVSDKRPMSRVKWHVEFQTYDRHLIFAKTHRSSFCTYYLYCHVFGET